MAIPLFILCIGSLFVGYLTKDLFIGLGTPFWNNAIFIAPENLVMIDAEFIPTYIKWLPVIVSLFGAVSSMLVFHFFKNFLFEVCIKPFGRSVYIFLNLNSNLQIKFQYKSSLLFCKHSHRCILINNRPQISF